MEHNVTMMRNIITLLQIMSANGLIACNVWPSLKELIITGNPLVNMNKGLPAIMKDELGKVNIIRSVMKKKQQIPLNTKKFKKVRLVCYHVTMICVGGRCQWLRLRPSPDNQYS
jgi:hypothetical protein